jgi:hypothetical protein
MRLKFGFRDVAESLSNALGSLRESELREDPKQVVAW